jgi:hypothetical protein
MASEFSSSWSKESIPTLARRSTPKRTMKLRRVRNLTPKTTLTSTTTAMSTFGMTSTQWKRRQR